MKHDWFTFGLAVAFTGLAALVPAAEAKARVSVADLADLAYRADIYDGLLNTMALQSARDMLEASATAHFALRLPIASVLLDHEITRPLWTDATGHW